MKMFQYFLYESPYIRDYFSIEKWFKELNIMFSSYPEIKKLLEYYEVVMNEELEEFKVFVKKERDAAISRHSRYIDEDSQIYRRNMHPSSLDLSIFYTVDFNREKVMDIVKRDKVTIENFPIDRMNIDTNELNHDHLSTAIHNKKPVFLIIFEPMMNTPYKNFTIDGSHRAYAKHLKNRTKIEKPTHKAYVLNVEQTYEIMNHNIHRVISKIHVNINLLKIHLIENNHEFDHKLISNLKAIN